MRLHPHSCGLGMSLPTPVLGVGLSLYNPKALGSKWELRRKQILEEVVNLSISFLNFINGDWKRAGTVSGTFSFVLPCLFLACGEVLSVLAVLGLWQTLVLPLFSLCVCLPRAIFVDSP